MKEHEGNINKPMLYINELTNQNNTSTKPNTITATDHPHHHYHHMNSSNIKTETSHPSDQQQHFANNNNNNEYNTTHINNAAQNLTINKNTILTDTIMTDCDNATASKTATSMKDLNRKSDEIDQHRLFKRPSSRIMNTNNNTMNPSSSVQLNNNDNNNFKPQTSLSSMDQSVLPTPPGASPSTVPANERSSK